MKILLAIDSSAVSEVALNEVAVRPWPPGTTVEVLSVVDPSHILHVPQLVEEVTQRTEELVQRAAERLRSCGMDPTPLVLSGDPKSVIVDRAGHMNADFVVVGSHGFKGVSRLLLGSVARAVVRFSPCSVEVVRSSVREKGQRGMKVLLATDGSDCSASAAWSIAKRPWPTGTEIRGLSVVELAVPLFQVPYPTSTMEALRAEAMQRSQDAIMTAEQILTDASFQTSGTVSVLFDSPKTIILDEASRWGADLIVVGSHGRRGINRLLLGSVSESVAMLADCSVEVIRDGPAAAERK
jgi:nucleotide-binding universal stress UspA family protein